MGRSRRATLALVLWLVAASCPGARAADELDLTVLHTNDLHGHLLPFAYAEGGKAEKPSVGGAARRATLIRRLRSTIAHPVALVDAGDLFTRGPLATTWQGLADVEALNAIGYDFAAIGNNEFKARDGVDAADAAGSQAALLTVVKRSRFHWLCANVADARGAPLEGVLPFAVRVWRGVRVGFLGLTAPRSAGYPQTRGLHIGDPLAAAKEWVPRARAQCDVLIAVTHIGVDLDRRLATETGGIDAIVGGDSHTFLHRAVEVPGPDGRRVPIVQTGEFGVNLGRLDLRLARGPAGRWELKGYAYRLLPVTASLPEAPDVRAALEPYLRPFRRVAGRVARVGATPAERVRLTTQALCDAMRRSAGADLALNPPGEGMFASFRRHAVTRYDVYAAVPYHNEVAVAAMTGAEIATLLRARPGMVVSGDPARLAADATYRVAMVDFVAKSALEIAADRLTSTGHDVRDALIEHLGAASVGARDDAALTCRARANHQTRDPGRLAAPAPA